MPRKKDIVKGGAPVARIRENSRLMRTHETVVDFMSGRQPRSSFLDVFTSGFFGLDFLRNIDGDLDDDIIYSDDSDDDDNFYPHSVAHRPLQPHPRIRQLTDEEADKHAKELIEEEERRKEKTERNKRKKMEEEPEKLDPSEFKEENPVIEINTEENESPESGETQNEAVAVGCDEDSGKNSYNNDNKEEEEENLVTMTKTKDEEQKDLDLSNSQSSPAKSIPEEMCDQRPTKAKKKEKTKLLEVKQSKEEKSKAVEEPQVEKKEEKHEPNKENTTDLMGEEFIKRSRELAGIGNHLAASGQYETAVKYFTDAIKYNPKEFKLFGNRSLCYERMQQYENALGDADLALCMEPKWIKGLFRKGKALCGLKRYYDASLIYMEVLQLESSSAEAKQELKRAQTLHLMEMGFTWAQSSEALKTHATLEEAVESLFVDSNSGPADAAASRDLAEQPVVQDQDCDEGEWIVRQTSRPRMQQIQGSDLGQCRSISRSPTPRSRNSAKPELYSVWVGSLAPAVTYATLHELFSRAGMVYSIKMLLEQQCAFVNYTRKEDCDRAIQCIDGMVVEGAPLSVRYPNRFQNGLSMSKSASTDPYAPRPGPYKKECFFWRTTGCTRPDCTFKHDPNHKNIDKDKFTSRLGYLHT
uniref:RNA polymerase II-associated protein 3 isoform X2 n=1 Tax=Scatophagus argus TaxID=75038 RepID=UPI001ED848F3|nr:RNA polymerase II-associated protein 3 isoform X2 [Scatophagus argus]